MPEYFDSHGFIGLSTTKSYLRSNCVTVVSIPKLFEMAWCTRVDAKSFFDDSLKVGKCACVVVADDWRGVIERFNGETV